ncbi:mitoguardin 2 isoform X1 [Strongylocentrotus purpuratus]|uniref:Mitoguardin n=1 Tax=Strongylocentrotus purpuratus TaxID=7668 RepID=A0A7M7NT83_STRPU|nr:mitoguardin 2 isoform X1 [Strongylocentrotus purpuratus]
MPLTNKTKVMLAVAFSVTVTGLMVTASLLRRRKRRKQPRTMVRPITNVFSNADTASSNQQPRPYSRQLTSSPKAAPRQKVPPMRPQSISSARASKASSISSLSSVSTLRSGGAGGGSGALTPINTSDMMTVEGMFNLGKEAFERAISYWRTALHVQHQSQTEIDGQIQEPVDSNFISQLEKLVEAVDSLRPEMDDTANRLSASNLGDLSLDISHVSNASWDRDFSRSIKSGDSASDSDSFVSAAELGDLSSLTSELNFFSGDESSPELYIRALRVVKEGGVQARRLRTEVLQCSSDEDFLAKLHCIRQATIVLFQDSSVKDYFSDVGLQLTADLLWHANYDTQGFIKAYDEMMSYVKDQSSWKDIEQELNGRKVKFLSFYDIVLDFFLLDAFDDLANPPSSILTVIQNRWLSDGVKETALATAVWSVLAAKRRMLQNPNGFLAKMYSISHSMTPALAWGFMGTNEELKTLMICFKEQVTQFCRDIFSLKRCRYSSIPELSEDIYSLAREYGTIINQKLNAS